MIIAIANDKGGFALKQAVAEMLREQGHEVMDLGTQTADEQLAHSEAGIRVAKKIQSGEAERGILFCGTGMGVSLTANKFKGVYAGVCESVFAAQHCRLINNCNVLCMGGYILGEYMAKEMADVFVKTEFAQDFIPTRKAYLASQIEAIAEVEEKNFH